MNNNSSEWRAHAQLIYYGVLTIAIAGILLAIYNYFGGVVSIIAILGELVKELMKTTGGFMKFISKFQTFGGLCNLALIAGYVCYLLGLSRFAGIQQNAAVADTVMRVRKAVITLLVCFAVQLLFGFLLSFPVLGLIFDLIIWIVSLVTFRKMVKDFDFLSTTPYFSALARQGAGQLRRAASANVWLLLMGLIKYGGLLLALLIGVVLKSVEVGIGLAVVTVLGTIIAIIYFSILAFFLPIFGWKNIMEGGPGTGALEGGSAQATMATPGAAAPDAMAQQFAEAKEKAIQNARAAAENARATAQNLQRTLAPKAQAAADYVRAHKKPFILGAATLALVLLLIWSVPKLFGWKIIEFQRFSLAMDTINSEGQGIMGWVEIDYPKGKGERESKVTSGVMDIFKYSELGKVTQSVPSNDVELTATNALREWRDDVLSTGNGNVMCELRIDYVFQNEKAVVFNVHDGIYSNGCARVYDVVVRIDDGQPLLQQQLLNISRADVKKLVNEYGPENVKDFFPAEATYYFSPSEDGCRVLYCATHYSEEVFSVPLDVIEPYLTEEGKEIFNAKPLETAQPQDTDEQQADEPAEEEPVGDIVLAEPNKELMGGWSNGTDPLVKLYISEDLTYITGRLGYGDIIVANEYFEEDLELLITQFRPDGNNIIVDYDKYELDYSKLENMDNDESDDDSVMVKTGSGQLTIVDLKNGQVRLESTEPRLKNITLRRNP